MIRTSDTRFRKPVLYPLSYGANLLFNLAQIGQEFNRVRPPTYASRDSSLYHSAGTAVSSKNRSGLRFSNELTRSTMGLT